MIATQETCSASKPIEIPMAQEVQMALMGLGRGLNSSMNQALNLSV